MLCRTAGTANLPFPVIAARATRAAVASGSAGGAYPGLSRGVAAERLTSDGGVAQTVEQRMAGCRARPTAPQVAGSSPAPTNGPSEAFAARSTVCFRAVRGNFHPRPGLDVSDAFLPTGRQGRVLDRPWPSRTGAARSLSTRTSGSGTHPDFSVRAIPMHGDVLPRQWHDASLPDFFSAVIHVRSREAAGTEAQAAMSSRPAWRR